jgi:O-methyltransferase
LFGLEVKRVRTTRPNPIHLWDEDGDFSRLFDEIKKRTLVDKIRCFIIYQLAHQACAVKGDAAEVGVYKGGTARLIAKILSEKKGKAVHLFDTFSGMPPADPARDIHVCGDFSDTSLDSVKSYLKDLPNIVLHQGIFPQAAAPLNDARFSFVHIDADIYRSVMDCCIFFYPRMEKGGMMIFDDYGFLTCPGAKSAVDEFFSGCPERPSYLPTGQCIVIKI